jgi:hypothetical protein
MPRQQGGGSVGQSLKYVDPAAPEQSAAAGTDLLKQNGLIVRPAIGGGTRKKQGGFYPSVMSGVVNAGVYLAPVAAIAGRRLFSQKQRRGGGKKGNVFQAQKEEAKAELDVIGKASAANVLAFVAAKRRGSAAAEEYRTKFRNKKLEKAIELEGKRLAKEEKKAAREAKRASKKAKKPVSSASTAASRRSKSAASNKSNRPITKAQIRREAEENVARAKAEVAAAKSAAKKPLKNSQVAWMSLIDNAAKRLANTGVPTRKNAMRYASLLKQGKNAEASAFLANFRARSRKSNKKTAVKAAAALAKVSEAAAGNNAGVSAAPKKANNSATKKRKSPSAAQKAYFEALRTARATLGAVGKPKPANMAKWASLKVSKKNNAGASLAAFEENFRSRVSAAPAAPAPAPKKAAKKALTAVAEAKNNENENEMQGYSENFEPEED